ncbi:unnamed protein product [Arabis nemorensis]|uniref:TF-B3 domain-containing protein n=1 Tax=Arabis nemorensis TaxID=586526 RepID=A0A565ASX1_9BRAS|nr:unnamed protein product [Arabis nemorensis]
MENNEIHVAIWHACSGLIRMAPILSSTVYYYPQGHVDNYGGSASTQTLCANFPSIKCHVNSMRFLADPATDEVFAHMNMRPMQPQETSVGPARSKEPVTDFIDSVFYKPLEYSDLIGGGLRVEKIFDKEKEDNIVVIHDIHNREWEVQHVYDNASNSHHLTNGWSRFTSSKKLHAGDELVFMRTKDGRVIVGIRRSVVSISQNHEPTGFSFIRNVAHGDKIARTGNGLCSVESLGTAMGNALNKVEFEAVYYPMTGKSSFFYDSEAVDFFAKKKWVIGMRVKKNIVVDHRLGRITHFGFITGIRNERNSPWKRLKVMWDQVEAEQLENCWEIRPDIPSVPEQKREPDIPIVREPKRGFKLFGQTMAVNEI